LRASLGYFGLLGYSAAIKFMPLYLASTIHFTIPIWANFMAYFVLKESITIYDISASIFTFAGVLLINDPLKVIQN